MSKNQKPEYNETLGWLYKTKNGYWSLPIRTEDFDKIAAAIETGARFSIQIFTDEQLETMRAKAEARGSDPEKVATAKLEIISAKKVREMDQAFNNRQGARRPSANDDL
jgi:hypothetical protein